MDPDSAKEKARLKTQEDNRKLGFPDRPVHGLPPRIPVGLGLGGCCRRQVPTLP